MAFIAAMVAASATGIVIAGIRVKLTRFRKSATTATTSTIARPIVACTSAIEARINRVRS